MEQNNNNNNIYNYPKISFMYNMLVFKTQCRETENSYIIKLKWHVNKEKTISKHIDFLVNKKEVKEFDDTKNLISFLYFKKTKYQLYQRTKGQTEYPTEQWVDATYDQVMNLVKVHNDQYPTR